MLHKDVLQKNQRNTNKTNLVISRHDHVYLSETETCCVGPPTMDGSWWRVVTKCGPLEKGMAKHLSIPALRTPLNNMKRQKDMTLKNKLPRLVGAQYTYWRKVDKERMKWLSQRRNNT